MVRRNAFSKLKFYIPTCLHKYGNVVSPMACVPPLFRSCSSVGRKSPTLLASTKPSRPSQKSNKSNTSVQSVKTNKRWERLTLMQGCLKTSFRNQCYVKIHTCLIPAVWVYWNYLKQLLAYNSYLYTNKMVKTHHLQFGRNWIVWSEFFRIR